jgi:hypothetical protein
VPPSASSPPHESRAATPTGAARPVDAPPRTADVPLRIAVALAVAWVAFLALLALLTANPPTFDRRQLAQADHVVTVEVLEREQGKVRVVQEWTAPEGLGELTIADLAETPARNGQRWIVPLDDTGHGDFAVTRSRLVLPPTRPNEPPEVRRGNPAVYPARPDIESRLAPLLKELRSPPDARSDDAPRE